jgi:Flp pilus assembly protein TadG
MRNTNLKNRWKFSSGQSMIEFLIGLPVLLLLVLGILQFALIYQAKTALNYAAFQTVRAGTLSNAKIEVMKLEFASNMAPLYTTGFVGGSNCTPSDPANHFSGRIMNVETASESLENNRNSLTYENVICARKKVQKQMDDELVKIQIVNPTAEAFREFGISGETIPNDNLMFRSSVIGSSGISIQDANVLKIHIGYCFELVVPFVNKIIHSLHKLSSGRTIEDKRTGENSNSSTKAGYFGAPQTDFARACLAKTREDGRPRYGAVLNAESIMRMQSPAKLGEFSSI